MQKMNNKYNESKSTSVSNRGRIKVREKVIANTRALF